MEKQVAEHTLRFWNIVDWACVLWAFVNALAMFSALAVDCYYCVVSGVGMFSVVRLSPECNGQLSAKFNIW